MDLDTVSELGRIVFGIEWALGIHIYFKDGTCHKLGAYIVELYILIDVSIVFFDFQMNPKVFMLYDFQG